MCALDDGSHKDVAKHRGLKTTQPTREGLCHLSKSNRQSQLRTVHPAQPGPVSESAAPEIGGVKAG